MSVVEPIVTSQRVNAPSAAEIVFTVPADLDYFRGHFAGVPVVAGVVQIKWALMFARTLLGVPDEFAGMERLKFQKVMSHGVPVTLTLEYRAERAQLRFAFSSGPVRYSSGVVLLGSPR
jgi:3-hydroxymyristoyl/3-hydroxydecanoyl-(acyl carrier protein) dehydratase